MTPTVTLRVVSGADPGKEYEFTRRAVGSLGRAADCLLPLPNDFFHQDVSRHHCQLEVNPEANPPEVRVRDLGSRNGTFVNGQLIGKRDPEQTPETALAREAAEYALRDGDEIKVGATIFRVQVAVKEHEEANEPVEMPVGCMHACGCPH